MPSASYLPKKELKKVLRTDYILDKNGKRLPQTAVADYWKAKPAKPVLKSINPRPFSNPLYTPPRNTPSSYGHRAPEPFRRPKGAAYSWQPGSTRTVEAAKQAVKRWSSSAQPKADPRSSVGFSKRAAAVWKPLPGDGYTRSPINRGRPFRASSRK